MRLRHDADDQGRGGFRRRLQEDGRLKVKAWEHLRNVDIEVVEVDCAAQGETDLMHYLEEEYHAGVEFAELDHDVIPHMWNQSSDLRLNDPHWWSQWGMHRSKVDAAWETLASLGSTEKRPVVVAVIDSGVWMLHEDLKDVLWTNTGEIPNNFVDDDGNGYVDDVHGYDFPEDDPDPTDSGGHGTHCAGVVGASTNNSIGVAGAAGLHAQVRIMALRFLGPEGGSYSDAIRALDYAVQMGAAISSNSWGSTHYSAALEAAIRTAAAAGHLFVTSAGNDGTMVTADSPTYPCANTGTLCVAATTERESLSSSSNYGVANVNVAAPGSGIMSTWIYNNYRELSGTSMACPLVAGAAALAMSAFPQLSASTTHEMLLASAERLPWLTGRVETGLLDVEALIDLIRAMTWLAFEKVAEESELQVVLAPWGSVDVPLRVGLTTASYSMSRTGSVEVVWPGGGTHVPISYELLGWPLLELSAEVLEPGRVVLVGSRATLSVVLRNMGNGTARARLAAAPRFPFQAMEEEKIGAEGEDIAFDFVCSPPDPGLWEANITLRTNSGVDPWDSLPTSVDLGTEYKVTLRCVGVMAPYLHLDRHSGAAVFSLNGTHPPLLLQPNVPAQWEPWVLGGRATGELVVPNSSNWWGCSAHSGALATGRILLISRGYCDFSDKAQHAQDAGALGVIIYDYEEPTTIEIMPWWGSGTPPGVPAYLITRQQGLWLLRILDSGQSMQANLTWEPILVVSMRSSTEPASGVLRISNKGGVPFQWKSSLGSVSTSEFYKATFSRSLAGGGFASLSDSHAIPEFERGVAVFELPFSFPFEGQFFDRVTISTQGVLLLGTHDFFAWWSPNGLLAPFGDRLVLKNGSRISAAPLPDAEDGSAVVVIQWEDVVQYIFQHQNPAPRLSFEVRLQSNGIVSFNVRLHREVSESYWIGWASLDGWTLPNLRATAQSYGELFSATLTPWFLPLSSMSGVVDPGMDAEIHFALHRGTEAEAELTVRANESSTGFYSLSRVRIMQRLLTTAYRVAENWSSCTGWPPMRTRVVECLGNDGLVYSDSFCNGTNGTNGTNETNGTNGTNGTCQDEPDGWVDSLGASCLTYLNSNWCTSEGAEGTGWVAEWGSFASRVSNGHTASTACCACGGGTNAPLRSEYCPLPPSSSTWTTTMTTTTGTTSTLTNLPGVAASGAIVSGAILADVTGADEFVANPQVPQVVAASLAQHADVPVSQVDVRLEALRRRLAGAGGPLARRLGAKPVRLDYTFTLPAGPDVLADVARIADAVGPTQTSQLEDVLWRAIYRGTSGAHWINITRVLQPTVSLYVVEDNAAPANNVGIVLAVIAGSVAAVACMCAAGVRCAKSRKRTNAQDSTAQDFNKNPQDSKAQDVFQVEGGSTRDCSPLHQKPEADEDSKAEEFGTNAQDSKAQDFDINSNQVVFEVEGGSTRDCSPLHQEPEADEDSKAEEFDMNAQGSKAQDFDINSNQVDDAEMQVRDGEVQACGDSLIAV